MSDTITLNLNHTVQRRDAILDTPIDDDLVLLNPENEEYYGMEDTGHRIWTLIEQATPVFAVINALAATYPDTPRPTLEADVLAFIQMLQDERLIEIID